MHIRDWRLDKGLSAAQMADLCGVAGPTIRSYENGSRRPRPEIAARIEAATRGEVTASELLGLKTSTRSRGVREDARSFEYPSSTNVSVGVSSELAELVERYGLDAPALIAEGGLPRLEEATKQAWADANEDALKATAKYIETHGTPAEQLGLV